MQRKTSLTLILLIAGAAQAHAAPPASQETCLDQSFALAEKAAAKKLPAEAQTKVEGLLSALEAKCTSGDLAGAEGDIKAVEAAIAGQ